MEIELSDSDVLTFALAGCNAAEVAAYAGLPWQVAGAMIDRALYDYAHPDKPAEPVKAYVGKLA